MYINHSHKFLFCSLLRCSTVSTHHITMNTLEVKTFFACDSARNVFEVLIIEANQKRDFAAAVSFVSSILSLMVRPLLCVMQNNLVKDINLELMLANVRAIVLLSNLSLYAVLKLQGSNVFKTKRSRNRVIL